MKRTINYMAIMGVLLATACSKDYLERLPLDELSPQAYFVTANDLKLYANRFYPLLPSHSGYGGGTFWIDQNSDNMVPGIEDARMAGTRTVPSSGEGWVWGDIRQANYFLDHCFSHPEEAELKRIYIAEVRFFKAFLYFEKLKMYGDVPWFTSALATISPELFAPRNGRKEVADSILSCLDYAIANLKPKSLAETGRLNKESAILFKARVCLYEGTWEKYHQNSEFGVNGQDGAGFIRMAAEAANQLMDMQTLSLYRGPAGQEYFSLFNQTDYSANPEVILWKKYDIGLDIYHYVSQFLPFGGGNTGVTRSLMDDYLCTDGTPISVSPLFLGYDSIEAESANRDPRLAQSILLPGSPVTINSPGGTLDRVFIKPALDQSQQFRATTGYCMHKGANLDYSQQLSSGGTLATIFFRFTEALLIYAEAKAELGTLTQADIDKSINLIRDRVGMIHLNLASIATDPDWAFPALSPAINEIRRERRIELAFEGHRWDDLARWRAHHLFAGLRPKGILYLGSNLEGSYVDYLGFNPARDYLAPIPSDEITLNGKLKQNPNW